MSKKLYSKIKGVIAYLIWAVSLLDFALYFTGIALDIQYSWWVHWLMTADTVIVFAFGDITA